MFPDKPLLESGLTRHSSHNTGNLCNQATNNGARLTSFHNLRNNHNSSQHTASQSCNNLGHRSKLCLPHAHRHWHLRGASTMPPPGIQCSLLTTCESRRSPYRKCRAKDGIRSQMAIYRSEVLLVLLRGPSCELAMQTRLKTTNTKGPPFWRLLSIQEQG
jgi:hypothetical protein